MSRELLLEQGLDLMLFGMGTVFVFLTLLVVVTASMSVVIRRWLPDDDANMLASTKEYKNVDERIVAAITAALAKHRCRRQQ